MVLGKTEKVFMRIVTTALQCYKNFVPTYGKKRSHFVDAG